MKRTQDAKEDLPVKRSMGRGEVFVSAKRVALVRKGRMIARIWVVIEVGRKVLRARTDATTARMVNARDAYTINIVSGHFGRSLYHNAYCYELIEGALTYQKCHGVRNEAIHIADVSGRFWE